MEKSEFNNTQINPTPTSPIQPNTQIEPPLSTTTISSYSSSSPDVPVANQSKSKKTIIILITFVIIIAATFTTLFITGIIGEHRIEVGDYTVIVDEKNWNVSIGQDGNTLVLMNKDNISSGIGILPYTNDITYDLLNQENRMKSFINQIDNVQFESQTEQTISNTKCIVVNIKYKRVNYANDEAIKAFCEGKDGTMFLIEVEGANQAELNSNLSAGVDIINTAKHK
jgi:hypothetical protein